MLIKTRSARGGLLGAVFFFTSNLHYDTLCYVDISLVSCSEQDTAK